MRNYDVFAKWDAEASVWVASSDDIPGLVAEAATWDALKAKLGALASELIELNRIAVDPDGGQLVIHSEDRVAVAA
jgi:predicted RNase H-like HicB family nuclease